MMTSTILRVANKVLVPLGLVFGCYIYFKGHQTPGGGFVAGLVAAVSLIVHRMSEGGPSLEQLLPCQERLIIGLGLLCAVGGGIGSLVMGLPFLTSNYGYVYLPGMEGGLEWATVMIFDLGVFLVVAAVVVGMINALSKELER